MPLHARAQVHTAGPNKLLLLVLCYRCCCCRCRSCCCYWSYSCNCCSIIVIYWCVVQFLILDSGTRLLTAHLWSKQLIGWPRASQPQASRNLDISWQSILHLLTLNTQYVATIPVYTHTRTLITTVHYAWSRCYQRNSRSQDLFSVDAASLSDSSLSLSNTLPKVSLIPTLFLIMILASCATLPCCFRMLLSHTAFWSSWGFPGRYPEAHDDHVYKRFMEQVANDAIASQQQRDTMEGGQSLIFTVVSI